MFIANAARSPARLSSLLRLPHLVEKQANKHTNKWIESHHNNGQFYYSFSHYTVHAATSCMGEIKNNRLFNNYFVPTLEEKLEKTTKKNIWRRKSESVQIFFCSVYSDFFFVDDVVVVFTRFSQIHSVNW